jgi:hypothetical protein
MFQIHGLAQHRNDLSRSPPYFVRPVLSTFRSSRREHGISLNRGPVRGSALVPEPKTVFAGTRQERELNTVCELARDLT